jgi:nucleotide-binding universal stress UspA family protein
MIELKQILVPTDFSEPSRVALRYGMALAETFGATLHVLHVVIDPYIIPPAGEGYLPPADFPQQLELRARQELEQFVPADWRRKHPTKLDCVHGAAFAEITRYAQDHVIDLIVIGTHGRSAVAQLLLGSVAEKVVRTAPCPVLTVRAKEHEFVHPQ